MGGEWSYLEKEDINKLKILKKEGLVQLAPLLFLGLCISFVYKKNVRRLVEARCK